MDFIVKILPFLPKEKDTAGLIKAIIYHIVVQIVASLVNGLLCFVGIGLIIAPIIMIYFWGGIVLSIMAYCGTDVANLFAKKEESAE